MNAIILFIYFSCGMMFSITFSCNTEITNSNCAFHVRLIIRFQYFRKYVT